MPIANWTALLGSVASIANPDPQPGSNLFVGELTVDPVVTLAVVYPKVEWPGVVGPSYRGFFDKSKKHFFCQFAAYGSPVLVAVDVDAGAGDFLLIGTVTSGVLSIVNYVGGVGTPLVTLPFLGQDLTKWQVWGIEGEIGDTGGTQWFSVWFDKAPVDVSDLSNAKMLMNRQHITRAVAVKPDMCIVGVEIGGIKALVDVVRIGSFKDE